ncbi:DUF3857 and transglutaminase domain-containing protein [Mucilaginibacter sp. UR6-1]|uniref:DUF3857 domain-containing transglutaminase family protein n=1 Tax=Mucilaginibacter sp. UR6-1 TaxID=1435643 RepID=UPI001E5BBFFD|nr:DUF3857 and transglutaminase domain-containing protein [Mucilaginibacter sp. UR6-1]MCC8408441.1 DUF3857 and transglutaminase domain-containing protein [Mucilaginibacter sp. UR6-1]
MFKKVFILSMLLAGSMLTFGQKLSPELYKASTIPDSLKTDADAVVRYKTEECIVSAPGKMVHKVHSVVTVLNENAIDETRIILPYDKTSSINSFQMIVYNADGGVIKKYKKSDMYDHSAIDNISIITDGRIKAISHTVASYPVTIEMIFEMEDNGTLSYGSWYLQEAERAVQYSSCTFIVNPAAGLRHISRNTGIAPQKSVINGNNVYSWSVSNLKAFKDEKGVPTWRVAPRVDFSPVSFQYDDRPGDMSTWANFGKWIQALNNDVNTLPPARAEAFKKMTANLKTDKEKAKVLYEYLQQNMRYVSIQLGIGGFKPFAASFVDEKKYGDCKALSNYMYAMLKAVNIPAHYALIRAGENGEPADQAFSQNRFNHAIICIPFKNDTTWLECTSNTQPFGVLGAFTENRNALLITETGGKLVNTPKSKAADNVFNSNVSIKLNADGSAVSSIKLQNTGEYRDMLIGIAQMSLDEQKEYLIRFLKMKQPAVFNIKVVEDKDVAKGLELELEYDKFSDVIAGNRQFYKPAAFELWTGTCPVEEKRKTDFYFDHPLQKNCVTTISLPEGFEVENMPANQALKFAYGDYTLNYVYDAAKNQVVSTAKFNLNNHIIPAVKYTEMQQYMDAVAKAQNKKLVIKRKA